MKSIKREKVWVIVRRGGCFWSTHPVTSHTQGIEKQFRMVCKGEGCGVPVAYTATPFDDKITLIYVPVDGFEEIGGAGQEPARKKVC